MPTLLIHSICLIGCFAVFLSALGLLRFPDFFTRTHAATKASAFGLGCLLIGVCLSFPQLNVLLKSIFSLIALFLTLPVASQALAEAVRSSAKAPPRDERN